MSKTKKKKISVGSLLSIPCNVKDGPISTESIIKCEVNVSNPFFIDGIIAKDFTDKKNGKVVAVVSDISTKNHITVLFNGEISNPGNPVDLPFSWVMENCNPVAND